MRSFLHRPFKLLAALTLGAATMVHAVDLEYYHDVYPFLKANCITCHNKTTTKAKLNMETPDLMLKGGESGPAIIPGKSAESLIVKASIHTDDMEMPPASNKAGAVNLTPTEIATLEHWIDQGAKVQTQEERVVTWRPLATGVHPIYSVALTNDGRYAACARSNQIFLYDLATRQFIARLSDPAEKAGVAHRALVQSLAFSPDGTRLASGSYREVKIWKMKASVVTPGASTLPKPSPPVADALVKQIATAGKVTVLNCALSPDGKQVVTGCGDGTVRVWETDSLKPIITLTGSAASRHAMAKLEWTIAAQGLEQAFQQSEATRITTQDKALDELLKKANDAIVAMKKVLPEKQKAAATATAAKVAPQKAVDDLLAKIAAAPGGKPDADSEKQLKDAQEKLLAVNTAEVSALSAVTGTESNIQDAEAEVKRITESKTQNTKALATVNAALTTAKSLQDKASAELTTVRQASGQTTVKPLAVTFSSDAQRVAAWGEDGALRVWAVATGLPIEESNNASAPTTVLTATAEGGFVATKGVTIAIGAAPHWSLERTLGGVKDGTLFADRVNAVRFSPDGKALATGGGELSRAGDVIIFDVASGKALQTWKERHDDAVLCLDYSPDGKLLASGAADKIAKVTEVATGRQMNLFEGHTHHVTGIAFRSDGRMVATAGADGVVMTWDMSLGERKKKIEGWTKEVTSLQFIGATNQIVTSAGDNLVRIVTDEGAEVRSFAKLPDFMQAAASTPNATIIGGGEDSMLRVWDGTNGKELAVFGTP